jgi:hypothetical protein
LCTPDEVNVVPGEVLELSLVAENHLFDDTFPVRVEVVARLENATEYTLFGPFPANGITIPAGSDLSGVVELDVPPNAPGGLKCVLRTVLISAEGGEYVDEDRCDLSVLSD